MATDGKDHAVQGTGRTRTPALQGPARPPAVGTDPAELAADIERTREELAGTIAAIVDRVSPKLVAARTRQRVEDSAKETAGRVEVKLRTGTAAAVGAVRGAADEVKERVSGRPPNGRPQRPAALGSSRVQPAAHLGDEPHVAVSSTSERHAPAPNPLSQDTVTIPVSSAGAPADARPAPVTASPGAGLPSASPLTASSVLAYRPAPESMTSIYAGAAAALLALLLLLRRRRR